MTLEDLPSPVLEGLRRLAAESSARGIRLFLFGSFARGDARPTSDLDLGYEMQGGVQPVNRRWLFDAVDALPTIRPIDLVDFASVSPAFRNIALSEQRDLQCPPGPRRPAANLRSFKQGEDLRPPSCPIIGDLRL
jgi:predicted nucleotidyltransferase